MALSLKEISKINKDELVKMYFNLQNDHKLAIDSTLKLISDKIDKLSDKLEKLSSDLAISKNVNNLLRTRIKDLEIRSAKAEQYSRRECLEISGIPKTVPDDVIEGKVLNIFREIGVTIRQEDVEACHRIGDHGGTIVKLSKRKDIIKIFANKKKLRDQVDFKKLGFVGDTKIFVNESLCGYNRGLRKKVYHKFIFQS